MTIALAVSTPEGIILASESRAISASDKWFKDYANKIYSDDFTVLKGDRPKIHRVGRYALIYSGISHLAGWISGREIGKLHRMAMAGTDFKVLAEHFYARLQEILKGHGFSFLLCGYDRGGNQLWAEGASDYQLKVNGGPGTQPRYCLCALGTVEAIAKLFKDEIIHYENMSLQEAFSFAMLSMSVGCKCLEWFDSLPAVSGGNIYVVAVTPWGIEGYKFPPYDPAKPAPATPWQIPDNAAQPVKSHGVGGHIYASTFRSGEEGDSNYAELSPGDSPVRIVRDNKVAAELWTAMNFGIVGGSGGAITFRDITADSLRGYITAYNSTFGDGLLINAEDDSTNGKDLLLFGGFARIGADTVAISAPGGGSTTCGVIGNFTVYGTYGGDIEPAINGDGDIGNNSKRWYQVRAVNIQSGDLCFSEETCPICGEKFKDGDVIVLLCKTVHEDFGTMTIPMHDRCKDTPATLTVEVPETETRYRFNPEIGDIKPYQVAKFIEQEEEVPQIKRGFVLDELTGQFTKKAVVVSVAKEGFVGRYTEKLRNKRVEALLREGGHTESDTGKMIVEKHFEPGYETDYAAYDVLSRGVKFYDEETGQEVPLRSILESVEVFPERSATKDEAIETVTFKRRKPVMKTISVEIGTSQEQG